MAMLLRPQWDHKSQIDYISNKSAEKTPKYPRRPRSVDNTKY